MATAVAGPTKLTKADKTRLRTGPILDIKKYIDVFTSSFCRQYEISHWQEDVAAECYMKWWAATQTHAEKMDLPQYAKRVIYNAAIQWECRYRKENHMDDLDDLHAAPPVALKDPEFDLDLNNLKDVERLILELRYGFGRGSDEEELSLSEIARRIGHSETWVRQRHAHALKKIEVSLSK